MVQFTDYMKGVNSKSLHPEVPISLQWAMGALVHELIGESKRSTNVWARKKVRTNFSITGC